MEINENIYVALKGFINKALLLCDDDDDDKKRVRLVVMVTTNGIRTSSDAMSSTFMFLFVNFDIGIKCSSFNKRDLCD